MKISPESVAGWATRSRRAARVFEVLGIDSCCNTDRTLTSASQAAGYDPDEVAALISGSAPATQAGRNKAWDKAPLTELTSHIVAVHRRTRRMLVDAVELLDVLVSGHAAAHPELWPLKREVEQLAHHLVPHMLNEERYLFPYIATMDQPVGPDRNILVPLFGTVQYPLQAIRHDHSEDLSLLATIRATTRDFTTPDDACNHYRMLYTILAEFADELDAHIHLENDILFPRAIEVERKASRTA